MEYHGLPTLELTRPAPGQTIKTDSPTQDNYRKKARLLGSVLSDLLAGCLNGKTPPNHTPVSL